MIAETSELLDVAIRAARAGGEVALARLGKPDYQKWKGPRNPMAGASLEVQERIVEEIGRQFPDHPMLLEESDAPPDEGADPLWIIDPLDGSLNFLRGIPLFAVSIGYREAGTYKIGVVYDPCRGELFQAAVNGAALLNGKAIRTDKFADGMDAFQAAVVGVDWEGDYDELKRAFQLTRVLISEVQQIRTFGSPALGLCYVAAGRLHAYFGLEHLKLWDVAAAAVILKEAGGVLTDIDGAAWQHAEEGYLATNGVIHGSMLGALAGVRRMQRAAKALQERN